MSLERGKSNYKDFFVTIAIMPVCVGAGECLVSGKIFCGIFQSKLRCAFPGKPAVCRILWIIADRVVSEIQ